MAKKKKVFQNTITYDHTKQIYSRSEKPSLTIPDLSLTIPEILKRYASGRPLNVKVYDEFDGGADHLTGLDIRKMDITEIHELMETTANNINALRYEADRRRKQQQDAALEASIIAKYEAKRKLKEQPEEPTPAKFVQLDLPIDPKQ